MITEETLKRKGYYTKNNSNCGNCDSKVKGYCTAPTMASEAFKTPNRAWCNFHFKSQT